MTQKKTVSKIIFSVTSIFLLTVFFEVAFCYAYQFEYNAVVLVFCSLLASGVALLLHILHKAGKIILVSLIFIVFLLWLLSKSDFISYFQEYIYWFIDYAQGNSQGEPDYVSLTKAIAFVLIFINVFFLQANIFRRVTSAVIAVGVLCFCGYYGYDMPKVTVGFALLYILLVAIETGLCFTQKQKDEVKRLEVVSRLAPIVAVVILLTSLIPSSPEPLKWKGARSAFNFCKGKVMDFAQLMGFAGNDDDKTIGFSDGIQLGGNIKNDNTVAFEIRFNSTPKQNIYVKGSVNDTYKNNGWTRKFNEGVKWGIDNNEEIDEYIIDYAELYYAIVRSGMIDSTSYFINNYTSRIRYKGIKTNCLLYSTRIAAIYCSEYIVDKSGSTILFFENPGHDTEYEYEFSDISQINGLFGDMINSQKDFRYNPQNISESYEQHDGNYGDSTYLDIGNVTEYIKMAYGVPEKLTEEELELIFKQRADNIRKYYTDVPKSVPDRVKKLAQEITKDAGSDYEKLKAIESYLAENYKYTMKPGSIPKGRDAVDYFLFDKNSGYCTYFASAMAIMARSVGIPTRMAQGYIVKPGAFKAKYDVTENDAHAWVEGYIEGIGWINFEPTPGYLYGVSQQDSVVDSSEISSEPESKPESSSSSSVLDSSSSIADSSTFSNDDTSLDTDSNSESGKTVTLDNIGGRIVWLLILLAIFILVLTPLIEYIKIKITFIKYERLYKLADNNQKVYMDFTALMKLLESKKQRLEENETLSEFALRINCFNLKIDNSIREVLSIYMKQRYGGEELNNSEQKKVELTRQVVETQIKENVSALKYFRLSYGTVKSGLKRFKKQSDYDIIK